MEQTCKRQPARYYLTYLKWYTALFLVVYFSIFAGFAATGRSFVWEDDGISLYIPKAYYFIRETRKFLASVLSGSPAFYLYDFAIGLGNAVPFHLEPLYWLYLLTDPEHVEFTYSFLMFLRFYLAGLSISVFLFYFGRSRFSALLASFAYLGCDYGIWAGFRHSQFIIPMIFLPLCLISMEEILRKKRWYLCTIFIWLHLWCGYYFTYMNTIAMGVYCLIRFFGRREGRTAKEFFLRARTIIGSYLLGVMIGNLTLASSFASYLSSSRTEGVNYHPDTNFFTYGADWVYEFFHTLFEARSPGYWLRMGYIPLTYAAIVLLFARKGKKSLKAALIVGTLFCMVPAVGYAMNGFSSISNRWCYMYAFVLAVILGFGAEELLALTKKERRIITAACVPFLLCYVYELAVGSFAGRQIEAIAFAAMLLTLAALYRVNEKPLSGRDKGKTLVILMVVSLWGIQYGEYSPFANKFIMQFPRVGEALAYIKDTPLSAADQIADDTFFRVATKRTNTQIQGASQVLDYYGTVHYDNATDKSIQEFYRTLGLTSWSLVRMKGFDGRAFLDTLASVKYYLLPENDLAELPGGYAKVKDAKANGQAYEIYENEAALPLGFTYDTVISKEQLLAYGTLQRQEILLQAAVVDEPEKTGLREAAGEELLSSAYAVPIQEIKTSKNAVVKKKKLWTKNQKNAKITFRFNAPADTEVYLYIKNLRWDSGEQETISYSCGDYASTYLLHGSRGVYSTKQTDFIINLGYHREGAKEATLEFAKKLKLEYDSLQICCQPVDALKKYADARKENVLENVRLQPNRVSGTVTLTRDKLLALSIPYDSGWTAYVDGKETELLRTNIMYMGLNLKAGAHTVELKYHMPGLKASLLISAAGLLIFAAALFLRARRRKMPAKEENYAAQHHHTVL